MRPNSALTHITNPELIRAPFLQAIEQLLKRMRQGQDLPDHLLDVHHLLDRMSLSAKEHEAALRRLSRAQRFLRSHERGMARFELCMLSSLLRHTSPEFSPSKSSHHDETTNIH